MKVVIIGATGETGRSIVNGLLESPTKFDITAVTRAASLNSRSNEELKSLGVKIVAADLNGPEADLVNLLTGTDIVISAIFAYVLPEQIPLANAAKKAGVKRFIPCHFGPACPPGGVMLLRDVKENVLNHVKKIYLPYTVIDVGWWYQIAMPKVPSGRADYALMSEFGLVGDGSKPLALTDLRDIGRYVAKIIVDPRTLNKSVFAYSELLTQQQVYDVVERVSGEKLDRTKSVSEAELEAMAAQGRKLLEEKPGDVQATTMVYMADYQFSWGIRGDNTPENARYLGYLIAKDLYPDVEFTSYESFVAELLEGKGKKLYAA